MLHVTALLGSDFANCPTCCKIPQSAVAISSLLPQYSLPSHTILIPTKIQRCQNCVMQVGFGDVWKQSLSELSGGQRSLLALSLILAMLLFKPAPIYILDEVRSDETSTNSISACMRYACTSQPVYVQVTFQAVCQHIVQALDAVDMSLKTEKQKIFMGAMSVNFTVAAEFACLFFWSWLCLTPASGC